jgi:putative ABC transport system permease protein
MIADTVKLIRKILIRRHNKMEDFEIMIPEELLKQHQRTQNIFNMVMLCIASISLLVGGIGIMNIMLASVLERTKEIGLRRAVGATRRDISLQFLLEAVILTFFGGLFGVGAGLVAAELIAMFAGYNTIVTLTSILVSFLVSTATGIIFGYYPARKASNLHPIEALRYE